MKSAILQKGENYYTQMSKIFNAIGNEQLKYNWLITDCECYCENESVNKLLSNEYIWISGKQLTDLVYSEEIQFIWGVFSGFCSEITMEEVLKSELPFANGYTNYWTKDVDIQHPLADIEIVAWDGSLTLFISKNDNLVEKFMYSFPLSENLLELNKRNNN
ncbi:hypothetical protein [Terrisporobacter mayombei]|uniref:DUF2691 domain-containing protein n=1 Tax=Terrisporobacter mayombei TaxID=1541 RepID=A0ABY9PWZ0_9FIRM|nr:hypothetical protein [Terrisporobacter mayombei]MCC3868075.1 hypothetical protein [Terrisporobacter mayombei]WMT80213.1 hypothetical protein TEMA_05260 [Terrisporobacter mayombei]